jgi:small subunit ribosomal protein S16
MAVRLRLRRVGARNDPVWRVVVADQRSPRDGRVIETIGHYNPQATPSTVVLDHARAESWLARGAQPTRAVRKLLRVPAAAAPQEAGAAPQEAAAAPQEAAAAPQEAAAAPQEASAAPQEAGAAPQEAAAAPQEAAAAPQEAAAAPQEAAAAPQEAAAQEQAR